MPISQSDQLFQLIKSLTKAEKRNFHLYGTRIQEADTLKFMQLFEWMEKSAECNDQQLMARMKISDKAQYQNIKRHLYKQLMISLRMIHIHKKTDIEIREYLDFSDILYGKGLYLQSLKILEKAKTLATSSNSDYLLLYIVEREKDIESRHITRNGTEKIPELIRISEEKIRTLDHITRLSNIRIPLHSHYIKNGHVRNSDGRKEFIQAYGWIETFKDEHQLAYQEKVYLYQSQVWYYYIILDFEKCLFYARQLVELCSQTDVLAAGDPDLLMRGYHYVLTCAYNLRLKEVFDIYLNALESYRLKHYSRFNANSQIISFLYVHYGRLNSHFLHENYHEGLQVIPSTLRRLQKYRNKLDAHRVMVFYFKIAWMHLMAGDPGIAIKYLNQILQMEVGSLREDIQGYSHLMFLMAHYDAGNEEIMEYLVKGAKQFFSRMQEKNRLQEATLAFFRKITHLNDAKRKTLFTTFLKEIEALEEDVFEKRSLLYLDIGRWVRTRQ